MLIPSVKHYGWAVLIVTLSVVSNWSSYVSAYEESEIHGYHFHTYFFQNNEVNTQEALNFRVAIQDEIDKGFLANCRLNHVNLGPRGPHPVGSYETCCNKTSISPALSWFMQNHGNLSVLLHPLTRYEVQDHTERSMFLGPRFPLDTSVLAEDLGDDLDNCTPIELDVRSSNKIGDEPKWTA